jgi:hypothetical protein
MICTVSEARMSSLERPNRTGPKTAAGKEAVAANLPHPVKHGLRTQTWQQHASVPCHPGSCPFAWEDCQRRGEAEQGCPVLPELEQARLESLIADLDPAEIDLDTGAQVTPAGANLPLTELHALAEYERLGTIMLVCERWFAKAGIVRASKTEGLAMQGAMHQYLYAMVTRDRMRERHGWTKRRDEPQTDLAAAILAVAVRRGSGHSAPVAALDGECRVLPPPAQDAGHTGAQEASEEALEGEVVEE